MSKDRLILAGSGIYTRCEWCETLVRLNKPLFGSLHFCLTDEEKAEVVRRRRKVKP